MLKISDAVEAIITENPSLNFCFHQRLLNLSQLARYIQPAVATRARKEASDSAILMALSRLQSKRLGHAPKAQRPLHLNKLTVHSGLCTLTFVNHPEVHRNLTSLISEIRSTGGFITLSEGIGEVTIILDESNFPLAHRLSSNKPTFINRNIASVSMKFAADLLAGPGVLYQILQQVTLQNINVIEVVSTATEFFIYMTEEDAEVAFESLYRRFGKRSNSR